MLAATILILSLHILLATTMVILSLHIMLAAPMVILSLHIMRQAPDAWVVQREVCTVHTSPLIYFQKLFQFLP